jgi:hypothetical protein
MTTATVVHDGWDPTAELLADAGRRLGVEVVELDLRHDRLGVRIGGDGAEVRHGATTLRPDIVVNRTTVTGLGLASASLLERQRPHGWQDRHVAARQEQGLLLAVFDVWERAGAIVMNPTTAEDLSVMPNAVVERLGRAGVVVDRRVATEDTVEILVARGRGIAHRGGREPGRTDLSAALLVAAQAGFDLGSVRLRPDAGRPTVTAWDHRPDLTGWADAERIGLAVWSTVVELDTRALVDPAPRFLVDEL